MKSHIKTIPREASGGDQERKQATSDSRLSEKQNHLLVCVFIFVYVIISFEYMLQFYASKKGQSIDPEFVISTIWSSETSEPYSLPQSLQPSLVPEPKFRHEDES